MLRQASVTIFCVPCFLWSVGVLKVFVLTSMRNCVFLAQAPIKDSTSKVKILPS